MTIGESISKYRSQCGLTQKQLAEQLFVSPELISKWENGRRIPDYQSVRAMAGIFGVTEDELTESGSRTLDELRACLPEGMSSACFAGYLSDFLKQLPERERDIFVLRYYFFEETEMIADRFGISSGNVRMQLSRLRARLKSFVRRKNDEKS